MIGVEPKTLAPGRPIDRFLPRRSAAARSRRLRRASGGRRAPSTMSMSAELQVKIAEGALGPTSSLQGQVQQHYRQSQSATSALQRLGDRRRSPCRSIRAAPTTRRSARPRKRSGQKRIDRDSRARPGAPARASRPGAISMPSKAQIEAAQAQVSASEIALNGVREEARVGQRTTLDVLNAQQVLVNARVALVTAQHDRVVASYTLLAAVGRLSPAGARAQACRSIDPACTISRCATAGPACGHRTDGDRDKRCREPAGLYAHARSGSCAPTDTPASL